MKFFAYVLQNNEKRICYVFFQKTYDENQQKFDRNRQNPYRSRVFLRYMQYMLKYQHVKMLQLIRFFLQIAPHFFVICFFVSIFPIYRKVANEPSSMFMLSVLEFYKNFLECIEICKNSFEDRKTGNNKILYEEDCGSHYRIANGILDSFILDDVGNTTKEFFAHPEEADFAKKELTKGKAGIPYIHTMIGGMNYRLPNYRMEGISDCRNSPVVHSTTTRFTGILLFFFDTDCIR